MKSYLCLLLCLCLLCTGPQLHAFDTDISDALDPAALRGAGAAVILLDHHRVATQKYAGFSNIAQQVAVAPDTVFQWGYLSSILVWISIMQQTETGLLSLDAPITDYLPPGFLQRIHYGVPTLLDLMNQTAGYEYCWRANNFVPPQSVTSLDSYLRQVEPAQVYEPGSVRTESVYSTALAGYIIEYTTGIPYWQYVREHILDPLGMSSSTAHPLAEDQPELLERTASGYTAISGTQYQSQPQAPLSSSLYPANGARGTASDLSLLMLALLPEDGETSPLFQKPETLTQFLSSTYLIHPDLPGTANGLSIYPSSEYTVGMSSSSYAFGFTGEFRMQPQTGSGCIVLSNVEDSPAAALAGTLSGAVGAEPYTGQLPLTAPLAGRYVPASHPQAGYAELSNYIYHQTVVTVKMYTEQSREHLYLGSGDYYQELTQKEPFLFTDDYGNLVYFVTNSEGNVLRFSYNGDEYVPMKWTRSPAVVQISLYSLYFCVLFLFVAPVILFIQWRNRQRKLLSVLPVSYLNMGLVLILLAMSINNYFLLCVNGTVLSYAECGFHFVINWVCTVFAALLALSMLFRWKKDTGRLSQGQKMVGALTLIVTVICLFMAFFWNLYC